MALARVVDIAAVVMGVLGVGATGYAWARPNPLPPGPAQVVIVTPPPPISLEYDCRTPGVRITLDGQDLSKSRPQGDPAGWLGRQPQDAFAAAVTPDDTAGRKYRRGGDRLPWLTVKPGPLATDGRSVLAITSVDETFVRGHFEADVSKVDDTTRAPAFGTPVVRLRGTFCLPARPANPKDTGP